MALGLETDGKPLAGVGNVPSWLTDDNAAALRNGPCIQGVQEDKACWHCKPTPKASKDSNEKLRDLLKQQHADQADATTDAAEHTSTDL